MQERVPLRRAIGRESGKGGGVSAESGGGLESRDEADETGRGSGGSDGTFDRRVYTCMGAEVREEKEPR